MKALISGSFMAITIMAASTYAYAADISVKAVMAPKETIKMDFGDGTKHFVLMVRREGNAEGTGILAGASVTEFGWHESILLRAQIPMDIFNSKPQMAI